MRFPFEICLAFSPTRLRLLFAPFILSPIWLVAQGDGTTSNVTSRHASGFTVSTSWPVGASQALIGVGENAGTIWTPTNGQTYSTSNPGGASGVRESVSSSISASGLSMGRQYFFTVWYRYWDSVASEFYYVAGGERICGNSPRGDADGSTDAFCRGRD